MWDGPVFMHEWWWETTESWHGQTYRLPKRKRQRECALNIHVYSLGSEKALLLTGGSGAILFCQSDALAALNCCSCHLSMSTMKFIWWRKTQTLQGFLSGSEKGKTKTSTDIHHDSVCLLCFLCSHFTYFWCFCCFSQYAMSWEENKSHLHKWAPSKTCVIYTLYHL